VNSRKSSQAVSGQRRHPPRNLHSHTHTHTRVQETDTGALSVPMPHVRTQLPRGTNGPVDCQQNTSGSTLGRLQAYCAARPKIAREGARADHRSTTASAHAKGAMGCARNAMPIRDMYATWISGSDVNLSAAQVSAVWLRRPSGLLVVFEKPYRSTFTLSLLPVRPPAAHRTAVPNVEG
jgi:hypothetical protein